VTVDAADVYKAGVLAARLERTPRGVAFAYLDEYRASGRPPIASTLPITDVPHITPAGAVPPFLAGLLPEGRRLNALRRIVKTSADDELSLLVAVGADTIGDVQVAEAGHALPEHVTSVQLDRSFDSIRFADLLTDAGITDYRPTLAGMQDKVSATMISLPVSRRHERYILKLSPPEYPLLVENEAFCLEWSRRCKISTAAARLVHDGDGTAGLLVTRFDRIAHGGEPLSLAVEDAVQALDLWPADKYNTTLESAAAAMMRLSTAPAVTARGILQQLVFAWLSGNGDLHAKNLSVVATPNGERRLAPAYDLPSTLYYGDTTLALTVGGRDTLSRARLREFAASLRLTNAATSLTVGAILARTTGLIESIEITGPEFDNRTRTKVVRQLKARRREIDGGW
jgi:serine/threonine-protein kinase HipA